MAVAGGAQDSNKYRYAGADWKVTKDLLLQYYYANLQDYYKQNFLGLVHVYPIAPNQSFKTDIRYFDSSSDGKNGSGQAGYAVARELRRLDAGVPLVLLTRDGGESYPKPMLSVALAQGKTPAALVLASAGHMATTLDMQVVTGVEVTAIDRQARCVRTRQGDWPYRALVLATGAEPVAPALSGDGTGEVLAVNDLDSYARFRAQLPAGANVILLDEPTAFLDLPNRYELCLLLKRLAQEEGKCILFSTHDLDIALSLCDSIMLIDNPQLYTLSTSEMIASGHIERLFRNESITFDAKEMRVRIKQE